MRQFSFFVLVLFTSLAFAQTYRWVDPATGKTMISDTSPPGNVKNFDKAKSGATDEDNALPFATRRAVENFPVILYTSTDCATECKSARDLLNNRGVPFTEKPLQKQEDFDELKALVGGAFVPTMKVGRQSIKGFLAESYSNLLDLAGYPTSAPPGFIPSGGSNK